MPITILFDYASAFPSVSHQWIRSILHKIRIPSGFLNAFNSLYNGNESYAFSGGKFQWIFSIKSGVLQGCPLSGTLFVIAIDPLLTQFEHYIHNPLLGAIYACADDIGAALKELKHLKTLYQLFERYRLISGLTLKPKKCFAILVACEFNPNTVGVIKRWLQQHIPELVNLQICAQAKYLGIFLGPKLGGINWEAPMNKFLSRTAEIANMRAPLPYACSLFRSKALSVLGYVAQVCKPPKSFKVLELRAASKILRLATNSFDTNCAYSLDFLHGPKLARPVVYLHSCMIRASAKTLKGFAEQHRILQEKVLDSFPLAQLYPGRSMPEGWDSEAFCSSLQSAYLGVHSNEAFPNSQARICSLIRDWERGKVKGSLQSKIAGILSSCIPNTFINLFSRRLSDLEQLHVGAPALDSHWLVNIRSELGFHLPSAPHSMSMCLFRTWTNGWFTSSRMHEPIILPCIFGCGGDDSLCHYLKCEVIWTLAYCCHNCHLPINYVNNACVHCVNTHNLSLLYSVFSTYHSLRKLHPDIISDAISSGDFSTVHSHSIELINMFKAEYSLST